MILYPLCTFLWINSLLKKVPYYKNEMTEVIKSNLRSKSSINFTIVKKSLFCARGKAPIPPEFCQSKINSNCAFFNSKKTRKCFFLRSGASDWSVKINSKLIVNNSKTKMILFENDIISIFPGANMCALPTVRLFSIYYSIN